jgi:CCR4-NOT transcription complex subunit 2
LLIGGTSAVVSSNQAGIGFGASGSRAPNNSAGGLYGSDQDNSTPGSTTRVGGSQLDGGGLLGGGLAGGIGGLGGLQQGGSSQRSGSSSLAISGSVAAAGSALGGDFGLLGLLGVIRMTDADRNALALGSDLTMLGLSLGSSEQIYSTFASPFSESTSATKEPHYQVRNTADIGINLCHDLKDLRTLFDLSLFPASDVLLHATAGLENWSPLQVSTGNPVLYLLRSS